MTTKSKSAPAQEITNEIIALLEKGTMPWRQPWKIAGGGVPLRHNGERYQGINAFLLGLQSTMMGYSVLPIVRQNRSEKLKGDRTLKPLSFCDPQKTVTSIRALVVDPGQS